MQALKLGIISFIFMARRKKMGPHEFILLECNCGRRIDVLATSCRPPIVKHRITLSTVLTRKKLIFLPRHKPILFPDWRYPGCDHTISNKSALETDINLITSGDRGLKLEYVLKPQPVFTTSIK